MLLRQKEGIDEMNEFTEEELEMLSGGIALWIEEISCSSCSKTGERKKYNALYKKICRLIDNYCDHKQTRQCSISEQVICIDCGEAVPCLLNHTKID